MGHRSRENNSGEHFMNNHRILAVLTLLNLGLLILMLSQRIGSVEASGADAVL